MLLHDQTSCADNIHTVKICFSQPPNVKTYRTQDSIEELTCWSRGNKHGRREIKCSSLGCDLHAQVSTHGTNTANALAGDQGHNSARMHSLPAAPVQKFVLSHGSSGATQSVEVVSASIDNQWRRVDSPSPRGLVPEQRKTHLAFCILGPESRQIKTSNKHWTIQPSRSRLILAMRCPRCTTQACTPRIHSYNWKLSSCLGCASWPGHLISS